MTGFRNIVVSFSYRQSVSVLLHSFQILNDSLSYMKYLFACLFVCLSGNYAVIRHYAARSGNFLPTFREKPIGPIFKLQVFFLEP